MNLKTFRARTAAEALVAVKRHFGPEAVILHTRTHREGGVLGRGGRSIVEITAAPGSFSLRGGGRGGRVRSRIESTGVVDGATSVLPGADRTTPGSRADLSALVEQVGVLRSAVGELLTETRRSHDLSLPNELIEVRQALIEAEVAEEIAGAVVRRIRTELSQGELADPSAVRAKLAAFIESMLPLAGPVKLVGTAGPTIIALVGPTGVGKTTTAAKLAANYRLRHGRKVGLVAADTYRIGAIGQLEAYARVIDVPLEAVTSPERMRRAIRAMGDRDIVLVDTTGRNPEDQARLLELKAMLSEAHPHEVHLVLSATSNTAVLKRAMERFKVLGINRLILTKLDEAVGFGVVLNCLRDAETRLSYVTTGQEVPDDIEVGRGASLAGLIVSGPRGRTGRALMHGQGSAAQAT